MNWTDLGKVDFAGAIDPHIGLKAELDKDPGNAGIGQILGKLDDPGLLPVILEYAASEGNRADIKGRLTAIKRLAEDRNSNRNTRKVIYISITGVGAATVVGSAFITLAATLASLKTIPVEGMVLLLGVDWFMAQARAMTNMVGNGVATIVIAKWENEFDLIRAHNVLNEPTFIPPEQPPVQMPASPAEALHDLDGTAK